MKKIVLLLSLVIGLFCVWETNAQTAITFAKGASSKTLKVTIPANSEKKFSVAVSAEQVINVALSGDIALSKTNSIPVVYANLDNGKEGTDNWEDGEGFLSVLSGRRGKFIFTVSNSSKRARTFTLKVSVSNNRDDYQGGIAVQ